MEGSTQKKDDKEEEDANSRGGMVTKGGLSDHERVEWCGVTIESPRGGR